MGCLISKKTKDTADLFNIANNQPITDSKSNSPTSHAGNTRSSIYSANINLGSNDKHYRNHDHNSSNSVASKGSSIWNFVTGKNKNRNDIEYVTIDPLYVIIPYFNYCGFKRRRELFLEFYDRIKNNPRIRIVICEATEIGKEFDLPRNLPNVFEHIHIHTKNQIWIKESLINIAVRRLPTHWKYIAWLDSDIHFANDEWAAETISRLNKYDVIQLFSTIVYLGPHNEAIKTDKSFGYMYRKSGKPYIQTYKYGFWHPGFAWACTKEAYYTMDGLIDFGILGSGDHHMALGLISKVECSHPKNIHPNYKKLLRQFEKNVRTLKLGYINGTILHYWHGDLKLRRYKERWEILTEHQYDPMLDIYKDPVGLYQLTDVGKRIEHDIRDYFAGRLEDDTRVMS
ncbi:hypothetical protein [Dishui Lake large algae virus 1]|nr:hypothetical protein [Dishui Lake large algae virus 1]